MWGNIQDSLSVLTQGSQLLPPMASHPITCFQSLYAGEETKIQRISVSVQCFQPGSYSYPFYWWPMGSKRALDYLVSIASATEKGAFQTGANMQKCKRIKMHSMCGEEQIDLGPKRP